jgi:predicted alpha/beta hydrolase
MMFYWFFLFPALTSLFGYLPSKRISGMEDLPKNVCDQWSHWGRHVDYLRSEIPEGQAAYSKIKIPFSSFSIDDDHLAPKAAVDWLAEQYSMANPKRIHLVPSDFNTVKIGHFGVFNKRFKDSIWKLLLSEAKN